MPDFVIFTHAKSGMEIVSNITSKVLTWNLQLVIIYNVYVLCIFIQIHNVHICTPPKHFCNPFLWLHEKDFESKEVSHCNHQKRILSCVTFVSELILPDNTKREIGFYQMYLHIMYLEIYYTCTLHYDVNNTHYTMCKSLNNRL